MFFAQEAEQAASTFTFFDIFMLIFTVLIAAGFIHFLRQPKKNYLGIIFSAISLAAFLFLDYHMIKGW